MSLKLRAGNLHNCIEFYRHLRNNYLQIGVLAWKMIGTLVLNKSSRIWRINLGPCNWKWRESKSLSKKLASKSWETLTNEKNNGEIVANSYLWEWLGCFRVSCEFWLLFFSLLCRASADIGTHRIEEGAQLRACLFRCKTSQVVSRKMRMKKMNCSRENILWFTVFGW